MNRKLVAVMVAMAVSGVSLPARAQKDAPMSDIGASFWATAGKKKPETAMATITATSLRFMSLSLRFSDIPPSAWQQPPYGVYQIGDV